MLGAALAAHLLRNRGVGLGQVIALIVVAAVTAVLGAKAYSVFERGGLAWASLSWEWTHGYRYPGALISLGLGGILSRRALPARLSAAAAADIVAQAIAWSMAVVRIGCFAAGCCHGVPAAVAWSVRYPAGSLPWAEHVRRGWIEAADAWSLAVHPLQLYLAAGSLLLALLLTWYRRRQRWEGELTCIFLLLDGLLKFGLEQLRLEYRPLLAAAAVVFSAIGLAGLVAGSRGNRYRPFPLPSTANGRAE